MFRIENMSDAWSFYGKMFSFDLQVPAQIFDDEFISVFIIAILFAFLTVLKFGKNLHDVVFLSNYKAGSYITLSVLALLLFILSAAYINSSGFNPFIYFRF